jgi:predicted DNA-binding protein (MmcQ/YjbR family)
MNLESYRTYCLAKKGVTENFPFDQKTLVFKVCNKMFALADVDDFLGVNLKANPEYAIELRESYAGIQPGWHMSKTHWNTVSVNSDVPDSLFFSLIDHSYQCIIDSLSKKARLEFEMG